MAHPARIPGGVPIRKLLSSFSHLSHACAYADMCVARVGTGERERDFICIADVFAFSSFPLLSTAFTLLHGLMAGCFTTLVDFGVGYGGSFTRQTAAQQLIGTMRTPGCGRGDRRDIARLMALAIHFDRFVRDGEIHDYAELAELGNVTRARVTQIMNLTNLAPEIQEELLFLPRVSEGRDPLILRQFQKIAARLSWREQKRDWKFLKAAVQL